METQKQKPQQTTLVRIPTSKKERIARVARKIADKENRYVTEGEIVDQLIDAPLNRIERKLGI
jgi:hypothetical protein